jgi:hypothetical protein
MLRISVLFDWLGERFHANVAANASARNLRFETQRIGAGLDKVLHIQLTPSRSRTPIPTSSDRDYLQEARRELDAYLRGDIL